MNASCTQARRAAGGGDNGRRDGVAAPAGESRARRDASSANSHVRKRIALAPSATLGIEMDAQRIDWAGAADPFRRCQSPLEGWFPHHGAAAALEEGFDPPPGHISIGKGISICVGAEWRFAISLASSLTRHNDCG